MAFFLLRFITHDAHKGDSLDPLLDKAFWAPRDIERSLSGAMIFPMLAFILCGLLTRVNKAGWSQPKCWKNNLGRCRIRCLDDERYILLCRNKASCCIPITLMEEKHPRPQPSLTFPEDVTLPNSFSVSLNTKFNDEVNFKGNESKETAGTPPSTPMKPTYPQTTVAVSTPKDSAVTTKTPSPLPVTSATMNTSSA